MSSLKLRVAARIRETRLARGLTQEKLAEKVERSVDAISAMERGLTLPGFETLENLAQALEVPLRDFFDADGDASSSARAGLLAALSATARQLNDEDLIIAVEQVAIFTRRRGGGV